MSRARVFSTVLSFLALIVFAAGSAWAQNAIVTENALPGNPPSEWDVSGAGDQSIQGFATDISVDQGETIDFKIRTDASSYRIDIYRLGFYGGDGARKVATVLPSATLPQTQPSCISDSATGCLDCGNWDVSASWAVPVDATSGIYLAKLVRTDPEDGRASHIVFIVRDDDGGSDLLFQTSDTTWQAYNRWGESDPTGGYSIYEGPTGKADKISYNRPFGTRAYPTEDWLFNAEYPMVRWLERNGFDVSYFTDVDTDRRGAEILEHQVFMSVGHDEYWSRAARENVTAARDAGVNLAFFSGNEIYWKIRWEDSIDGNGTPMRTLVCYKEGDLGENQCFDKCDPVSDVWTGLWRSGCDYTPPADGCEPENALSGQISWLGTTGAITVPSTYKDLPLWRNTSIATLGPEETATFPSGTLGYEWDFEQYEDSYPAGRIRMSETHQDGETHQLSLYRHSSGALVFGAGTVQWSWGLDANHDRSGGAEDARMQQATVNVLADMGVQPATLQTGLVAATPLSDSTAPVSVIAFPTDGSSVEVGTPATISGTASDSGGGAVALIELSFDGGATWQTAQGLSNWSYQWTPTSTGPVTIMSRATDGAFNTQTPGAGISLTVDPHVCPCTLWSDAVIPGTIDSGDALAVELGMKFQTEENGYITAIRFYKAATNTGVHVGNLWASDGTLLGSATFSAESASGWQEEPLNPPVAVTANSTYVVSYHTNTGYYSVDSGYFASTGLSNPPLRALAEGEEGSNGVYKYGATSAFPTDAFNSSNYWVDVRFHTSAVDDQAPYLTIHSPATGALGVAVESKVTATFNESVDPLSVVFELRDAGNNLVTTNFSYDGPSRTAILDPAVDLDYSSQYTATLSDATDLASNSLSAPVSWSFNTEDVPPPPPDEGPGGPILVVGDAANPFTRYPAEILRTEGLNAFTASDISSDRRECLGQLRRGDPGRDGAFRRSGHHVQRLGERGRQSHRTAAGQATGFTLGIERCQPAPWPRAICWWIPHRVRVRESSARPSSTTVARISTISRGPPPSPPCIPTRRRPRPIRPSPWSAWGATAVRRPPSPTTWRARWSTLGREIPPGPVKNATAPRPSVRTISSSAMPPAIRKPDWVDLNKVAIPQADEQQRLLANLILTMNEDREPLPRFLVFPQGIACGSGDDG